MGGERKREREKGEGDREVGWGWGGRRSSGGLRHQSMNPCHSKEKYFKSIQLTIQRINKSESVPWH